MLQNIIAYILPGGCTRYILGRGTCHREGYLFSRYWYKERYQVSQFWYKETVPISRFFYEIYNFGYTFSKIGIKSGILFQNIGIRKGYVFEASMARPRPKSGQVHPAGYTHGARLSNSRPFLNHLILKLKMHQPEFSQIFLAVDKVL